MIFLHRRFKLSCIRFTSCSKHVWANFRVSQRLNHQKGVHSEEVGLRVRIVRPDILKEWNTERNKQILQHPDILLSTDETPVWWTCAQCHTEFQASTAQRVGLDDSCPTCTGMTPLLQTANISSPAIHQVEVMYNWHYIKNAGINPEYCSTEALGEVWWLCAVCGHEWRAALRTRGKCLHCEAQHDRTCPTLTAIHLNRMRRKISGIRLYMDPVTQKELEHHWETLLQQRNSSTPIRPTPEKFHTTMPHLRSFYTDSEVLDELLQNYFAYHFNHNRNSTLVQILTTELGNSYPQLLRVHDHEHSSLSTDNLKNNSSQNTPKTQNVNDDDDDDDFVPPARTAPSAKPAAKPMSTKQATIEDDDDDDDFVPPGR